MTNRDIKTTIIKSKLEVAMRLGAFKNKESEESFRVEKAINIMKAVKKKVV